MTLKILDTEMLIGFFKDLDEPLIFSKLAKLGYKLKVPVRVYSELKGISFKKCQECIKNKEMSIFNGISEKEIIKMKNRHPKLGNGELEVIAWGLYCKRNNIKYYCILNDKEAKNVAKECNISFSDTKSLLYLLVAKKELTKEKVSSIIQKSKKTRYII